MSKYVKNLLTNDLKSRLDGVSDMLLVNVVGMGANANVSLRRELREKNIQLMVVKNSLAERATEGTPLAVAFEGLEGAMAILWGGEDIVSLAKEVARLAKDKVYEPFGPRGGVMDGQQLSVEEVRAVSKWPSREEQLSILLGQILSPGASLSSQLLGPGGALASQIDQKANENESTEGKSTEGE